MAKIEKIIRVENNMFGYGELISFQTDYYIGEWNDNEDNFTIFSKDQSLHAGDVVCRIYADSLEELIHEVKEELDEEIIEVYNHHITTITFNIPD